MGEIDDLYDALNRQSQEMGGQPETLEPNPYGDRRESLEDWVDDTLGNMEDYLDQLERQEREEDQDQEQEEDESGDDQDMDED